MMIEASKCRHCEKVIVPPRRTCPYCGNKTGEMSSVTLGSRGSVLSYTILEMPPDGFERPLVLALIELDQGAVVLCLGQEIDMGSVGIGSAVEVKHMTDGRLSFTLRNEDT
ncbi:MAG: OB-fold domain-containing protein [Candidatus Thorarchaeota archaeon]|nr:MAG: OB-fold domain-containing protein [Candidatus Thorarchaeota archaeon]